MTALRRARGDADRPSAWSRAARGASIGLASVTHAGWTVLGLGVVAWFVGVRWGWLELDRIAAGALVGFLAAAAFTVGRFAISAGIALEPERLVAGETATGRLRVTNITGRRLLPLRVELAVGRDLARFDVPSLEGGGEFAEKFAIPTSRRSVVAVGPVRSVKGDPLGLLRREAVLTEPRLLYVHPRTVRAGTLSAGWIRDLEGAATNDLSMSDVAFHSLREYVPGDDRRHIHWRSTAKRLDSKLMVREFVDSRRSHLALVLTTRADHYAGDDEFEVAVSTVASLAAQAFVDDHDLTCFSGGRRLPTRTRNGLFDALAGVDRRDDAGDLRTASLHVRRHAATASIVVVVTGSDVPDAAARGIGVHFGADVRVLVARVGMPTSRVRHAGETVLVDLAALDDLPRLVMAVRTR